MFYQDGIGARGEMQKYGCLYCVLLYSRIKILGLPVSQAEANVGWMRAIDEGLITGDLNKDGDFDDQGEAEIHYNNLPGLIELLHLPLIRLLSAAEVGTGTSKDGWPLPGEIKRKDWYIAERWRWKYNHFVAGAGAGTRPVEYDPIRTGSLTVRNGNCVDLRVFEIDKRYL